MPTTKPTVCPLDCPDRCALDVTVEDDGVLKIDGSHRLPITAGYICAKVRGFGKRLDSPLRVLHPMKRVGPKGSGEWVRVSWDEALDEVAARFQAIEAVHGPEAILPYAYSGSNGLLTSHGMDERFWNRLGASKLARTLCAANTGAGWTQVLGDLPGADPLEVTQADAIVLWGVNPSASGIHLVPPIREAQARGAFLIVVDPRRTPLAKDADLHLPVHPGADVALALSMCGVLLEEGLHDREFVARHARGLESLRAASREWSPERAGDLARVESEAIRAAARALAARRRVFFRVGWGLERNRNGTDAVRAVLSLRALLGRFGERGAGVALSTSKGYRMSFERAERPDLRKGDARTINMSQLARALEEEREPPIEAVFVYNANPIATVPDQQRLARAFRRESLFTVVHEQLWTDSCELADLVLPATTFLEHKELCRSYGGYALQWGEPVVTPRGEARSNHAVFAELGQRMGFAEDAFRESEDDLARAVLAGTPGGIQFEELKAKSVIPVKAPLQFGDVFPSRGFIDMAGAAPPRWRPSPVDGDRPLTLISPASGRAITSTLFEGAVPGSARLSLSPEDAAARGLASGDLARACSSWGEVVALVDVTPELPSGVASMPKGLWRSATRNGWTATALAPDHVDEQGGGACYNDARIEVERARGA